jgi:hypothetical protein
LKAPNHKDIAASAQIRRIQAQIVSRQGRRKASITSVKAAQTGAQGEARRGLVPRAPLQGAAQRWRKPSAGRKPCAPHRFAKKG